MELLKRVVAVSVEPSLEEFDPTTDKVIHRRDDLDCSLLFEAGEHAASRAHLIHSVAHVLGGNRIHERGVLAGSLAGKRRRRDGRLDFVQQRSEVTQLDVVDSALYGSTGRMTHHNHNLGPGRGTCELEAADQIVVGNIPRDTCVGGDERWTVPVSLGIGQLLKFGHQSINLQATTYYNVVAPPGSAHWTLELLVQFLFPE